VKGESYDVGPKLPIDVFGFLIDMSHLPIKRNLAARYGIVICWKFRNRDLRALRISSEDAVISRSFSTAFARRQSLPIRVTHIGPQMRSLQTCVAGL
jgi:hypothetical protein